MRSFGIHRWRRHDDGRDAARRLVEEAEAFLKGAIGEHYAGKAALVPAWVALNPIAHADLGRLRAISAAAPGARQTDTGTASYVLAREVLAVIEDDDALLAALQRVVLRPLELRLIEKSSQTRMSAYDVVSETREVLRSVSEPPRDRAV